MSKGRADKDGLTVLQKAFAHAYVKCGVAAQAAREAGYSPKRADQQGNKMLTRPEYAHVQNYIKSLAERTEDKNIHTLEQLRQFWTTSLLDRESAMKDRLKASELLGKSLGAFIDKVEHSGKIDGPPVINLTVTH